MSISDKLVTIAENEKRVYDTGYLEGGNAGYTAGYRDGEFAGYGRGVAEGVKSGYDQFWNEYQENGAQNVSYAGAFSGSRWNDITFTPKYDIVPNNAQNMFWSSRITDLVALLEKQGVIFDTSNVGNNGQMFAYSRVTRIGVLDFKNKYLSGTFGNTSYLHTIEKLIVNHETTFGSAFSGATALENIAFEGVIAQSGLNFQHSTKLSRASIESIIAALSTTASGKSITLSKTAVNAAFETSAGAADGSTSDVWLTMMGEEGYNHPDAVCIKPSRWNVSLA